MSEVGSKKFKEEGRIIQAGADTLVGQDRLLHPKPIRGMDLDDRLRSFADKLKARLEKVAPGQENVFLVHTGVKDTAIALNGVAEVIQAAKPKSKPAEKAEMAKRSYGVLVRYAIDKSLASTTDGLGLLDNSWSIDPTLLEFIDSDQAYVRVRNDAVDPEARLMCPAFASPRGTAPRLPRQMWDAVIDIYKDCGVFNAPLVGSGTAEQAA